MKQITVSPMCQTCEEMPSEKNGLCYDCWWIHFGMTEYYKPAKKAKRVDLWITGISIFVVALIGILVWILPRN